MSRIALLISLLRLLTRGADASDTHVTTCPSGNRCFGATGNYSAYGFRGCIRTQDCVVQVNMVLLAHRSRDTFDYVYYVCLRGRDSQMDMFFTTDLHSDGHDAVHASIVMGGPVPAFKSFVRVAGKEVKLNPTHDQVNSISGFHRTNRHLVRPEADARSRNLKDGEEEAASSYEGSYVPVIHCDNPLVMFYSKEELFYKTGSQPPAVTPGRPEPVTSTAPPASVNGSKSDGSSDSLEDQEERQSAGTKSRAGDEGSGVAPLNLRSATPLYLKIKVTGGGGEVTADALIALHAPESRIGALIYVLAIVTVMILICTKCLGLSAQRHTPPLPKQQGQSG